MSEYLRRKIDVELLNWLKTKNHAPALISGIRQCGKSRSIKEFADRNFKYVNKINFWETPDAKNAFEGSLVVNDIIKKLSLQFASFVFAPGETILILDEIQDCPRARLALKSFKEDGRFEVIASGSYIGLNLEQKGESVVPMPNGAEDIFHMKTMDFEEFLRSSLKYYVRNQHCQAYSHINDRSSRRTSTSAVSSMMFPLRT